MKRLNIYFTVLKILGLTGQAIHFTLVINYGKTVYFQYLKEVTENTSMLHIVCIMFYEQVLWQK